MVPTFTCGFVLSNFAFAMDGSFPLWSLTKGLVAGLLGERGRDVLGDFLVVVEFHAVAGTALRERAKVGRVAEGFGQRDHRVDDLGFAHGFGAHDDPSTGVDVSDDRPEVI